MKLSSVAKDCLINIAGVATLFSTYYGVSKLLDTGDTRDMLEEAAKIAVIVAIGSITSLTYKNLMKNKEDKHFRLHLLGTLITNMNVVGAIYFTKVELPPRAAIIEANKTLLSTPYFLNLIASYLGDGAATIVNNHFDVHLLKKRTLTLAWSLLPVVLCNALFYWKFDKDSDSALSEVAAIGAFNFVVNFLGYVNDKVSAKDGPDRNDYREITPS